MAGKKSMQGSNSNGADSPKVRGKRKPTEYRFETVDDTGKVEPINLTLSHQESAMLIKDHLNQIAEANGFNYSYRFTKVIVFQ